MLANKRRELINTKTSTIPSLPNTFFTVYCYLSFSMSESSEEQTDKSVKGGDQDTTEELSFISTSSTSFSPEDPLAAAVVDNKSLARRRRRKTSTRELEILEQAFRVDDKPIKEKRLQIAQKTGMTMKAVQVGFNN